MTESNTPRDLGMTYQQIAKDALKWAKDRQGNGNWDLVFFRFPKEDLLVHALMRLQLDSKVKALNWLRQESRKWSHSALSTGQRVKEYDPQNPTEY